MKLTVDLNDGQDIARAIAYLTQLSGGVATAAPVAAQPAAPAAVPGPVAPVAPGAPAPVAPQPAAPAPVAPAAPGAPVPAAAQTATVDTTALVHRLTDLTRQLGPRGNEVGALIQAHGVTKVSDLQVAQLQDVVQKAEALVGGG